MDYSIFLNGGQRAFYEQLADQIYHKEELTMKRSNIILGCLVVLMAIIVLTACASTGNNAGTRIPPAGFDPYTNNRSMSN
jgi:hypothetical protein